MKKLQKLVSEKFPRKFMFQEKPRESVQDSSLSTIEREINLDPTNKLAQKKVSEKEEQYTENKEDICATVLGEYPDEDFESGEFDIEGTTDQLMKEIEGMDYDFPGFGWTGKELQSREEFIAFIINLMNIANVTRIPANFLQNTVGFSSGSTIEYSDNDENISSLFIGRFRDLEEVAKEKWTVKQKISKAILSLKKY